MAAEKSTWIDKKLTDKAKVDNVKLVFDRFEQQQPQCPFGMAPAGDVCCKNCYAGPCRITPGKQERGICGASADVIVARNLLRHIAAGASAHGDHARKCAMLLLKIAQGKVGDYKIKNGAKLRVVAKKLGVKSTGQLNRVAELVAVSALEDFRRQEGLFESEGDCLNWLKLHAQEERMRVWRKLGTIPTNLDSETTRALHRTTMGCDADYENLLLAALRAGIADGYAGMHMATDMQDIIFGTPSVTKSVANLGVLRKDCINLAVHGHKPALSEKIVEWSKKMRSEARKVGAAGINVVGICCTGNEVLMRHGIPLAAHEMQQEMAIATGALDAIVVDTQCIYPSVQEIASCYHTKIITTVDYVRIPGAMHMPFREEEADKFAQKVIAIAIGNFRNRSQQKICIPDKTAELYAGFSAETIIGMLAKLDKNNPLKPLANAMKSGELKGIVAIVGCRNPKLRGLRFHEELAKRLIKNNVLVVSTGCASHALAQDGLMAPAAVKLAGMQLAALLKRIGKANKLAALPPCLHMGSCVDNSRIGTLLSALSEKFGMPIHKLPLAASAPEHVTEKSIAIVAWALALGLPVHINPVPPITGSRAVTEFLADRLEKVTGGKILFGETPEKAAKALLDTIEERRKFIS